MDATDDEWRIIDLGSRHGTYVNTIRLDPHEETPLALHDFVRVGPWVLQIVLADGRVECKDDEAEFQAIEGPCSESTSANLQRRATYPTRESIFIRLRADDTASRELTWREFVGYYGPVIRGFARNAGVPAQEVDDVLQDVLIGFFRVSNAFQYDRSKGLFRGYLKRITLNAIRTRHRRQRPAPSLNRETPLAVEEYERSWEQEWTMALLRRALEEAQSGFGAKVWEAFELYGRRGVPANEVARRLDMTPDNVRHAKFRVVAAVRDIIQRLRADEG